MQQSKTTQPEAGRGTDFFYHAARGKASLWAAWSFRRSFQNSPSLLESRDHLRQNLISIPWEGLKLSAGDPAIPVVIVPTA